MARTTSVTPIALRASIWLTKFRYKKHIFFETDKAKKVPNSQALNSITEWKFTKQKRVCLSNYSHVSTSCIQQVHYYIYNFLQENIHVEQQIQIRHNIWKWNLMQDHGFVGKIHQWLWNTEGQWPQSRPEPSNKN